MTVDYTTNPNQPQQDITNTLKDIKSTKDNQTYVPLKSIGNYTFQQSIGKGSMGKVKLGVHNVTGEKIAIKIVPRANFQIMNQTVQSGKTIQQIAKEKAREENREVRTIREAHIMMLLRHPNIVKMKEITPHGPYFYILMDYVGGGQLLHYIVKSQRLSDKRTRLFSRQIVSALDYLHRNSIVHRDLKIENIMVDKSGRQVKIIDFGLSNLFCPERQLTTYCGSLYFAAPELLKATPYNGPEIDIWSLGVIIYVMATGAVPFDDKSMAGLHEKIKSGVVTYPAHLNEDCKDLLSRIFVTDPSKRIIMADIINHPWLNKDAAAPINNHMPIRKPLTLPLNSKVIEKMSHGFNLGSPEEIERRLTLIIQSPVYNNAISHIANYNSKKPSSVVATDLLGYPINDDPQSIPAAYHPFISLYYLTSERLAAAEHEAHQQIISMRANLSRKASIESLGGVSSACNSQNSLVGGDDHEAPRLLTDVPLGQTPVIPQINQASGKMGANGSFVGFDSAAISSNNYLSRIQRWLRSSLSQHHLSPEPTVPTTLHKTEDHKHHDIQTISEQDSESEENPEPSSSSVDQNQILNNSGSQTTTGNDTSDPNRQQSQGPTPTGSKSLFRKLSKAFLRKNSVSRPLNKKSSNLSNPIADSNASDDEWHSAQKNPHNESSVKENETVAPPPVPPKDFSISYMAAPQRQQHLPPGMSMATVTSRQTAHTIDISQLNHQPTSNLSTPIASKMSRYENPVNSQTLNAPNPTISRSASITVTPSFHRRRGSVSKMADKMNTWLNRSTSLNHQKLNKTEA